MDITMKLRKWFLDKAIALCDLALTQYSEAADDQNEVNEVVKMRNYFIKQRDKK